MLWAALAAEMRANQANWVADPDRTIRHPATEFGVAREFAYLASQNGRDALSEQDYSHVFTAGVIDQRLADELRRRRGGKRTTGHVDGGPCFTPPSDTWAERIEAGEDAEFDGFAKAIGERQRRVAGKAGPILRGFHAKPHAGLRAEFRVLPDLPAYARQGLFSQPQNFKAVVRFSNGDSGLSPDPNRQPRGVAIKLWGVTGPKLLPGQETANTQDFLATSHSVTSTVRNVRQFMEFVRASDSRSRLFSL
jgi:hypothetical protein